MLKVQVWQGLTIANLRKKQAVNFSRLDTGRRVLYDAVWIALSRLE